MHRAKSRVAPALFAWAALTVAAVTLVGCSERFEWREFRSREGFVVSMPGRWQTLEREIEFGGNKVPMQMTSTGIGASIFAVGVARLPSSATATVVDRERSAAFFADALVRNIGATTDRRMPIAVPRPVDRSPSLAYAMSVAAIGRAGREARTVDLAARVFIVDDRAFEVVALTAPGEVPPDVLETFFTSFRLNP